jgi:hypothetical protein
MYSDEICPVCGHELAYLKEYISDPWPPEPICLNQYDPPHFHRGRGDPERISRLNAEIARVAAEPEELDLAALADLRKGAG